MKDLNPAQLAHFDRKLEEGLDITLEIAQDYDHLDPVEATRAMFEGLNKVKAWRREELAMATAALAIRLHRRAGGR